MFFFVCFFECEQHFCDFFSPRKTTKTSSDIFFSYLLFDVFIFPPAEKGFPIRIKSIQCQNFSKRPSSLHHILGYLWMQAEVNGR